MIVKQFRSEKGYLFEANIGWLNLFNFFNWTPKQQSISHISYGE